MSIIKKLRSGFVPAMAIALCLALAPVLSHSVFAQKPVPAKAQGPKKQGPIVVRDWEALPTGVKRMRYELMRAAHSGDMELFRAAMQINELKPLIEGKLLPDPVKSWKQASVDGSGREFLAMIAQVLELPPARVRGKGGDIYVWPYLAAVPLAKLGPPEIVQLYRLAPARQVAAMLKSGQYGHYFLTMGEDGTWHFLDKGPFLRPVRGDNELKH